MTTLKDKFHELGNWHNKISMAVITTRESLMEKDLAKRPEKELNETIEKATQVLQKIEGYVAGADKTIHSIKPFIYEKIGGDTEIPLEGKPGGYFL